jgi:hypothetical protein
VWEEENLARKVKGDWNMVYLARREGVTAKGTVTWKSYPCLLFIKQPPAWLGLACGCEEFLPMKAKAPLGLGSVG